MSETIDVGETISPLKHYTTRLDSILANELTPDSIDTYAEEALNRLVALVEDVVGDCPPHLNDNGEDKRQRETNAFQYYGLNNIETVLDHIKGLTDELYALDKLINAIPETAQIFLPPDKQAVAPSTAGTYISPGKQSRTKSILFLLANELSINPYDPERVILEKGILTDEMMRGESYVSVVVPEINRAVLVCDEENNITFVLNTLKLKGTGITPDRLHGMTKQQIKQLLREKPEVGGAIIYSPSYMSNVLKELENNARSSSDNSSAELKGSYLRPNNIPPPDGYLSLTGMVKSFGTSHKSLSKVIGEIKSDELGPTIKAKFGPHITVAYSPEQQELIKQILEAKGLFAAPAPEGYLSISGIATALNVGKLSVKKALLTIDSDRLGPTTTVRFGVLPAEAYSPEQQELIRQTLAEKGLFVGSAPEDHLPASGISIALDTSYEAVRKILSEIDPSTFGSVRQVKSGPGITNVYSSEQQKLIQQALIDKGLLAPTMPEGYLTVSAIAESFGIAYKSVVKAIASIDEAALGPSIRARFHKKIAESYSPEQQDLIRQALEVRGTLAVAPPEGYTSLGGMADDWNLSANAVNAAVAKMDLSKFGPTIQAKFGCKVADAYSPEQQELIRQALESRGLFSDIAPEGYLALLGVAKNLGVSEDAVRKSVTDMTPEELGPTVQARFGSKVATAYSPEQQERIKLSLEERGLFIDTTPDGYASMTKFAKDTGFSKQTVQRVLSEIDPDTLGPTIEARLGRFITQVYSPEQQELIRHRLGLRRNSTISL
jgi:hypothetical protein